MPRERTIAPFDEPARFSGPLYTLPFASLLNIMMVGFPLGVARRGLDEFATYALESMRAYPRLRLADDHDVQTQLGLAEASLRSTCSYVHDVVARISDDIVNGGLARPTRIDLALAVQQSMRGAIDAIDTVYSLCGASTIKRGNVIQRCWRDLHAAAHHIVFSREGLRLGARALLAIPQDETRL